MKMKFKAIAGIAAVASTMVLSSCVSDADSSGLEYMPDMYRSAAIEPYVDYGQVKERRNEEFATKISALVPPVGTIPYFGTDSAEVSLMLPYHRLPNVAFKQTHGMTEGDFTTEDSYALAAADKNPFMMTADNRDAILSSGKSLFKANCAHCHGEKGDGQGPMVTNGIYAGVPDYKDKSALSDGQMFYSIYYGKGQMGAHSSILNKKEIWTLVHYIRSIQDSNYGTEGAAVVAEPEVEQAEVEVAVEANH